MKINTLIVFFCLVAIAFMGVVAGGQPTTIDSTFNAVPSGPIPNNVSISQLIQPDGKIVGWGASLVGDGVARGEILRLNADGSVDPTFSYCGCGLVFVSNVALQPNGQFIVAGIGQTGKMIRLNADGSIDPSFVSGTPPNAFGVSDFTVVAIQPDGKILAYRRQSNVGFVDYTLYRFNQDGSVDGGFTAIQLTAGSPAAATVGGVIFLPDGRFYLALTQGTLGSTGSVRRFNANGSADSTWETPSFTSAGFPTLVSIGGISLDAGGNVLVAGKWDSVNGSAQPNLIRLFPAGNIDLTFAPPVNLSATQVESLAGGKILYSQLVDIAGIYKLFRLNSDGTNDATFTMDPTVSSVTNRWARDVSGNIIFLGSVGSNRRFVRLFPDGGLDGTHAPNVTVFSSINTLVRQTDGKIISAGNFSQMNGVARAGFARTDSAGNLDPTFDPGSGFNVPPDLLTIQNDGKILAIGGFNSYNGVARSGIVRINPNGTIDGGFAPEVSSTVYGLSLQTDGRIIISGSFTSVNSTLRTKVARLETDGTLDNSFNPMIGSGTIYQTIAQSDGKIMIGGGFTGVNGFNRTNLVRLNSDGGLDQTFNTSSAVVGRLWIQPDGKYLTTGTSGGLLARKNSDGSVDGGFTPASISANSSSDTQINSVLVRSDGSLLVGGRFDRIDGVLRPNFTRLAPNGEFDPLFLLNGANSRVRQIIAGGDNKVLLGGDFTKVDQTPQPGISRLNVGAFRRVTQFDFDGDGKADISVFRPSENKWYILRSSDFGIDQPVFAISGDIPVAADFDGDGKTDLAVFRPSVGDWWYRSSITNTPVFAHWGNNSDTPRPSDFNGDGRADYVVFRPSANIWYRASSANNSTSNLTFGSAGDKPVIGDFDGDQRSDVAIYRPSTGDWWWQSSIDNVQRATHWGISSDVPAPGDYDGDGKTDFTIYRPSTGVWYILNSSNGQATIVNFGLAEDKPVPADYDGDGRTDIAVYRPSTGVWYLLKSTEGFAALQFGISTDVPVPNAFVP